MQPGAAGSIQITMTPRQLDVIMCILEGMMDAAGDERRELRSVAEMVEKGADDWKPEGFDYDGFGCDFIVLAPVWRQMVEAWRTVDIERGTGNEFDNVYEFVEALKTARAAVGGEEVCHA